MNRLPRLQPSLRHARMTMIEIMVAMSVLTVIMVIVAQTLHSTQLVFRRTQDTSTIYEQARLITDIVTRDLQGMVTSNEADFQINYGMDDFGELPSSTAENWKMVFVTSTGLGTSGSDSETLMEVGYLIRTDGGQDTELWRAMNPMSDQTNWDFINAEANPSGWAGTWNANNTQLLADNLLSFEMDAYSDATTKITSASDDTAVLPSHVRVSFELQGTHDSSVRHFYKTIFLRRGN